MIFLPGLIIVMTAIFGVSSQPSSRLVRIGDVATALADSDVTYVARLAACGTSPPWLMIASHGQIAEVQFVEAFCTADQINGALRLGQLSWIVRDKFSSGLWGPWTVRERYRYAQVVPDGRSFEQVTGIQDVNRPFQLFSGEFTDEELISLVRFLRSGPTWAHGTAREHVESKWPITMMSHETDGRVVVRLNNNSMEGQRVIVRRSQDGWAIISVNFWVA